MKLTTGLSFAHRLPSASRRFPTAGGLLSYAANIQHIYGDSALYLDRILKGAGPGDLPVKGPVQIELVINLVTANALGLTIVIAARRPPIFRRRSGPTASAIAAMRSHPSFN